MVDQVCIRKRCNWTRTHGMFCRKHKAIEPFAGMPVCAAVGCTESRNSLSLFCKEHKFSMYRGSGHYAQNIPETEPEKVPVPVVKAAVTWVTTGPVPFYRAEHPDYWDGIGASPGAALRAMRLCEF